MIKRSIQLCMFLAMPMTLLASAGVEIYVKNLCPKSVIVTTCSNDIKMALDVQQEKKLGYFTTGSISRTLEETIKVKESGDGIIYTIGEVRFLLSPTLYTNHISVAPIQGWLKMAVYDWWEADLDDSSEWWSRPSGTPKVRITVCG
ncbi:hypothetical protein [Fangia hongkongensis]|uniref:hypothetical protein n=1 Tax=Fangia hongkongensis TaxID=270495 RepID=UPI00039FCE4E|nr:hypothetical protein [Fangia hongkongensis]MBK2124710.1 hypothetical protein [Fangia hongkongensis]